MPQEPDLTGLLQAWTQGDRDALAALAPLVQQELRDIARRILASEPPGSALARLPMSLS